MATKAKAVRITESGEPEVLKIGEIEVRDPGPGELLIEVAAAGLNRADTLQRRGLYPAPVGVAADVPGLEYAGVVARADASSGFAPGDRVMGIVPGAGMATHVVVPAREALPVPTNLSMPEAAAIPEAFLTAFDALFEIAGLRQGELALVHAAGSGVGTAAIQLIAGAGARSAGTSRKKDKLKRCEELGLEHAVHVTDGQFAKALADGPGQPDVILDTIGAKYLSENIKAVALKGRIVTIGLLGGARAELSLGRLLPKRARIEGSVLRSRPSEEKAALAQSFRHHVLPGFATGRYKPVIDDTLPMSEIQQAHERMDKNHTFGKLVLTW